jgi:benzoylformate decarboxylase
MPFTSGKQAFLEILKQEGVEIMFGNPGTTELPLMDGLAREPGIRYILALQESVAIAMADGYAQASGKIAAVNVHTSPGLGNAMGMLYDAMKAGSPLLLTAGQHDQAMNLTEPILWSDLPPVARPYVKWSHEITRLDDLPRAVRRAVKTARAHPTVPCSSRSPVDVLNAERQIDLLETTRIAPRIRGDKAAIEAAADLLVKRRAARRHRGRRRRARGRDRRDGGGGRAPRRARLCGVRALHLLLPLHASALRGRLPALGPAHPCSPHEARSPLQRGRRHLHASPCPSDVEPMPEGLPLVHLDLDPWEIGKNYPGQGRHPG